MFKYSVFDHVGIGSYKGMPGGMIRTCQHVPSIPSCPFSIVIPCQARASHQKLTDGSLTLGPAGPKRPIRTGQRISSCHPDLKSARWHLIGAPSGNAALGAQEKKCRSFRKYSRCYSWQDEYLTGGAEYSQYGQHSRDSPHRKIGQAGKYKTYGWYKEGKKYSHGVSVQCSSKFDDQSKGPDDHRTQTGRAWADRKRDRAAQKNERGQQAELAEGWQARKKRKVWESNEKGAVSPGTAEARGESCPQMSGSTKEGLAEGLAETGTIASDLPGSGGHVGRAGSSSASQSDHAPVGKGSENAQGEMAAALVTPPVGSTRPPPLTGRMGSTERRGAALEGVRFLRSVEREGDEWAEREEDDPTWGGWGGRGASEEHFPAGSNGGGADWEVGASGVKSAGGIAAGGRESAYQRKEEEEEEADGEDRWQGVAEGGAGGAGEGEGGSATSAKMTCQHEGDSLQSSASSSARREGLLSWSLRNVIPLMYVGVLMHSLCPSLTGWLVETVAGVVVGAVASVALVVGSLTWLAAGLLKAPRKRVLQKRLRRVAAYLSRRWEGIWQGVGRGGSKFPRQKRSNTRRDYSDDRRGGEEEEGGFFGAGAGAGHWRAEKDSGWARGEEFQRGGFRGGVGGTYSGRGSYWQAGEKSRRGDPRGEEEEDEEGTFYTSTFSWEEWDGVFRRRAAGNFGPGREKDDRDPRAAAAAKRARWEQRQRAWQKRAEKLRAEETSRRRAEQERARSAEVAASWKHQAAGGTTFRQYEERWFEISAAAAAKKKTKKLILEDIPWPPPGNPLFLERGDSLEVRKRKLKKALLIWHPDKFAAKCGGRLAARDQKEIRLRAEKIALHVLELKDAI
eukprot:jgi/Mesen1/1835/ME000142S01004